MKNTSTLQSPQPPLSPGEENQDLIALDLQQRLLEIVESQEAFDLMRAVRRQEEEKQRLEGLYGHQPRQYSTDAEEDDDGSAEFSFYKFSIQHFQGYMSHRHITQRLRQPLLKHDDEGDALVRGQGPIRDALFRHRTPLTVHLSHRRRVWLCGGLSCVSWRTCRSQNGPPVLRRPSLGICLTDGPGGSATWWDWTRYQCSDLSHFLEVPYCAKLTVLTFNYINLTLTISKVCLLSSDCSTVKSNRPWKSGLCDVTKGSVLDVVMTSKDVKISAICDLQRMLSAISCYLKLIHDDPN